jgi:opacity protein-like surface antigen
MKIRSNSFTRCGASRGIAAAIIVAALLALPQSARAQARPPATTPALEAGQWTVTPVIGTAFSGDVDSPTFLFGVAGGYNWSPRISLEAEFNMLPSSEQSGLLEIDTRVWNLTGNVLYHFSEDRRAWVPYGAVGLGYGHGSADINVNDPLLNSVSSSSNAFVFSFGGGVERGLTDGIRFRGDLRYFFGGDLVADYWRLGLGVSFDVHKR